MTDNSEESISFFMLAHGQYKATEKCLESIRKYYKNEKIIVFENATNILEDICTKYLYISTHKLSKIKKRTWT